MKVELVQDRRIQAFRQRFGDGHFYLACHAALPLALTPDLLYRLWAAFQRDSQDHDLAMPWIAVSDLLLSGLCAEVGHELYEMERAVRDELMQQLKGSPRLGLARVREVAEFVIAYSVPQLESADLDTRDFAQAQQWRALAYKNPREAARTIATTLAGLSFADTHEWIRLAALVQTLEEPLAEFPVLLGYVGAICDLAKGDERSATAKLNQILDAARQIQVADVNLPIPEAIKPVPLPSEHTALERATHLIDLLKHHASWLISGGVAATLAITAILYTSVNQPPSPTPSDISSATPSPQFTPPATSSPNPTASVSPSPTVATSPLPSGLPKPSPTSTIQPTSDNPVQPLSSPVISTKILSPQPKFQTSPIPDLSSPSPSNPSTASTQPSPTSQQPPDNLTSPIGEILDAHNQCRSRVGVAPLKWSSSIASFAQEWADQLSKTRDIEHRSGGGSGFGENIAAGGTTPTDLVNMWCSEQSQYNPQTGQCVNGGMSCYHFTQVVWKNTTEVGCGLASHRRYGKVLVCNYNPPGNYRGQRPY